MPATNKYGKAYANLLGGESSGDSFAVDYLSDTIKGALLADTHTPDLDTHEVFDDVDGDEISGTGYTAGGATLGSKTITYTAANSWGTAWQADTAYAVGDIVRPSTGNGHLYICIVAGTSADPTEPTWPTVSGQCVTDGTAEWAEIGRGVTQIDAGDPSWGPGATLADIKYLVVYKDTGTPSTSPLLWLLDLEGPHSVTNGSFSAGIHALGLEVFATP